MSFKLRISEKDKSTGRFKSKTNRLLIKKVMEAKRIKKLTQSQIADLMEVDKSVLSRIINGQGNLTLKTIGDLAWAVGLEAELVLSYKPEVIQQPGVNSFHFNSEDTHKTEAPRKPAFTHNFKNLELCEG